MITRRILILTVLLVMASLLIISGLNSKVYANSTETKDQIPYTQAKLIKFLYFECSDIQGTLSAHIYIYKLMKSNGEEPPVPVYAYMH